MTPQERVIQLAKEEVGYHEKASFDQLDSKTANSGSSNFVKYSRDLEGTKLLNGRKRGIAWCAIFVIWIFYNTFGKSAAKEMMYLPLNSGGAGCNTMMGYYKSHNSFYSTPVPGDQVFFSSNGVEATHTGIVTRVGSDRFYTVEGNSDDQVQEHSYKFSSGRVMGFGRPKWEAAPIEFSTKAKESPTNTKEVSSMGYTGTISAPSGKTVNMRARPESGATIVARVPIGETVDIRSTAEGWAAVTWGGKHGYMMSEFIDVPEEEGLETEGAAEVAEPIKWCSLTLDGNEVLMPLETRDALIEWLSGAEVF
jgi:hypothetical protein